jgi:putative CocE/NonD family hydrolase
MNRSTVPWFPVDLDRRNASAHRRWQTPASMLLACALLGCGGGSSSDPADPTPEPPVEGPATPTAFYLTMRDGVRIAVDLWLPAGASATRKVPTIMRATRYSRDNKVMNREAKPETDTEVEARDLVKRGYAHVVVDARGSSASFGTRSQPWSPQEAEDYGEIVDWVASRPWSNGRVASVGTSYDGNTAELIGTSGRAAVKVMVPRFAYPNVYTDIVAPGGVFNQAFVKTWLSRNRAFDDNDACLFLGATGDDCAAINAVMMMAKPVDADTSGSLLSAAVAEHAANPDQFISVNQAVHADDRWNGVDFAGLSPGSRWAQAQSNQVAVLAWASWLDLGTAGGALNRWKNASVPMNLVLGPWNHGADQDSNVFSPREAPLALSVERQHELEMAFIDRYMKGTGGNERKIVYFTMGEEGPKETTVWPPAGAVTTPYYLGASQRLSAQPAAAQASDRYVVDFTASTGEDNGWWTKLASGDVFYADRSGEDAKLLVYTTAPLAADAEITGHPSVTLHLSSTETDGAIFAYLEDVAPDGKVTYITEGQLRLLHRKLCQPGPTSPYGPCHSYLAKDAAPMTPGVVEEVTVGLSPTSALIKAGHSLRVAIAGHDASTFARIPATATPVLTVMHGPATPSRIDLPIVPRK